MESGLVPRFDFSAPRLFVETPLSSNAEHISTANQTNYLVNVLRLREGDDVSVFNGKDGEWRAHLIEVRKGHCRLRIVVQIRPQENGQDIHYLFAPLKRARMDYMVQKAVEMGVSVLNPVITSRTQVARVNLERMRANAIEAAEQCGILHVPDIEEPQKLTQALKGWTHERPLIYCDESAEIAAPIDQLRDIKPGPLAVLIGPEGGFETEEQTWLKGLPFVTAISLGPRIMRADTAGVAALALVNAVLGDWQK